MPRIKKVIADGNSVRPIPDWLLLIKFVTFFSGIRVIALVSLFFLIFLNSPINCPVGQKFVSIFNEFKNTKKEKKLHIFAYIDVFTKTRVILQSTFFFSYAHNTTLFFKYKVEYLSDQNIGAQLVFVKSKIFGFLPGLIPRLETQEIPLADSISIVEEA